MSQLITLEFSPDRDMNQSDIDHIARLSLEYDRVRAEFLAARITPGDYLDFVATLGTHMDRYVATLTRNLESVGIIT
jgi:hypothetical protein